MSFVRVVRYTRSVILASWPRIGNDVFVGWLTLLFTQFLETYVTTGSPPTSFSVPKTATTAPQVTSAPGSTSPAAATGGNVTEGPPNKKQKISPSGPSYKDYHHVSFSELIEYVDSDLEFDTADVEVSLPTTVCLTALATSELWRFTFDLCPKACAAPLDCLLVLRS
jgi:hypothetical protein